jgi:hypothetical protein
MLDTFPTFLNSSLRILAVAFLLASSSAGKVHAQDSEASASADAGGTVSGGSGSDASSAGASSSADASAGPESGGGVTAGSTASTDGSASAGDPAVSSDPSSISASASATSGDTPIATSSTSAGTSATSTAGNYKSAYAVAPAGTVYSKLGKKRGYVIGLQDGAYSAAYYRGDTASSVSGVYTTNSLTKADARALVRSFAKAGAIANRNSAAAWAAAGTDAVGSVGALASSARTRVSASAFAKKGGAAGYSASAEFSASHGFPESSKSRKNTQRNFSRYASCANDRWYNYATMTCRRR